MLLLETQHLSDLAITQRRLPLTHLPCNLRVRRILPQEPCRRHRRGDGIIRRVEYLKPQSILPDRQMTNLAQIPRVDVAPRIALPRLGLAYMCGEVTLVFVGFDDIPNAEDVDVVVEAAGEGAGGALATELAAGVCVHGVDVVGIFIEGEGMVGEVFVSALGETDAVDGFRGGDDDLMDAEFGRCLDDVVGRHGVDAEGFVVRHDHVSRAGGEVDYCVGWTRVLGKGILGQIEEGGEGVESLAVI